MITFLIGFASGIFFILLVALLVAKYKNNALTVGATNFLQQYSQKRSQYLKSRLNGKKKTK